MCQRTVLIVEDEILIRMMLAEVLEDQGYRVIEAGNVLEAVAALSQMKVDAVVTDIDMPGGLSGLDLAKLVFATLRNAPLIIASGGHRLDEVELPDSARFVAKPYAFDAIAKMLGEMIAGEERLLAS